MNLYETLWNSMNLYELFEKLYYRVFLKDTGKEFAIEYARGDFEYRCGYVDSIIITWTTTPESLWISMNLYETA